LIGKEEALAATTSDQQDVQRAAADEKEAQHLQSERDIEDQAHHQKEQEEEGVWPVNKRKKLKCDLMT